MVTRFWPHRSLPLPIRMVLFLLLGLGIGFAFPRNPLVEYLYLSGTFLPKILVTFAAFCLFFLLAGAVAGRVLGRTRRIGAMAGLLLGLYAVLGLISLLACAVWIAVLSDIPLSLPGAALPGPAAWAAAIGRAFADGLSRQPLLQALAGGVLAGWATAACEPLHRIARGFIAMGDRILRLFEKLLWYAPIMVGCLAMGIPMQFGTMGIALYAQGVSWVLIATCTWVLAMILCARFLAGRTWKQILSYAGAVWPTAFATGGACDALAVTVPSAGKDLGLDDDVARMAIAFGTVFNRNCATMSALIVTVVACKLLRLPLSLTGILLLIPPVLILGLGTPGIPGGAGFFLAPVIAALLDVPDRSLFITTFVAVFSGLIPLLSAAGDAIGDGAAGALLQDRFGRLIDGQGAPTGVSAARAREVSDNV